MHDWKRLLMEQRKTVVIKVGSSLLANSERLTPRWAFMHNLMEDIARLREGGAKVILCSSGSVALGLNMIGESPETAGLRDKQAAADRKSTRLNSSHVKISYAVFCL